MVKEIGYNPNLTADGFSEGDKFRKGKKARVLFDAQKNILGSVSDSSVFDLKGNEIATLKSEERREKSGGKIRVAEYASDTRSFRLVDNKFYTAAGDTQMWTGYFRMRERNKAHIIVLSVLAAALTAMLILLSLIGLPFGEKVRPVIDIRDVNGGWEAQGTVAVFPNKVKPGNSGEYEFILNNPHNAAMAYSISLEPLYEGEKIVDFPITFRLKMNNVVMQSPEWKNIEDMNFSDMTILAESTQSFTLEWRWAFDDGNNENDTVIGADGGKISIVINVTAQAR